LWPLIFIATLSGIAVEIWAMASQHFGNFVAGVPAPLGIGSVQLDTGEWVKGFICEPAAIPGAPEITQFGGWTHYLRVMVCSPAAA
jgi:allophanate hydrolase